MTNQNLRTYKPLAPKSLAPKPLVPKPLTPRTLEPVITTLTPSPLLQKPTKPVPLSQNQNFSGEMGLNSTFFMEYETNTLMMPKANIEFDYYLEKNDQENYFHEDIIPIDILDVEGKNFNAEDLTVSMKS